MLQEEGFLLFASSKEWKQHMDVASKILKSLIDQW
jgi:hypothetical protein